MGWFSPYKRHANSFNYTPRYYDPVKEERDQRRKELHGTSAMDEEEEYVPGKYIRTQREAREASHADQGNGSFKRMRNLVIIAVMLALFGLMIVPRFVEFANLANEEKMAKAEEAEREAEKQKRIQFTEEIEHIDGIENGKQLMENFDDMEAWQRTVGSITIVPNDYDFSQDK